MTSKTDDLIAQLVETHRATAPMSVTLGLARAGAALAVAILMTGLAFGLRPDLVSGNRAPLFLVSAFIFLALAVATVWTAVQMGRPSVGSRRDGWAWAALMASSLPVAALLTLAFEWSGHQPTTFEMNGWTCLVMGTALGLMMAVTLTGWLRRGAPVSPKRAGLVVGLASGSAGIFAVSLFCPHDDIAHIGMWHGGAVILCAVLGRLTVPRFIHW